MYVYIDIETIPSTRNESRIAAAAKVHPPGNIKKADTLAKWEAEQRPALEDEAWRKTSLNGGWGELACGCWAVNDGPVEQATRPTLEDDERFVLRGLFDAVAEAQAAHNGRPITWVGHNITGFDLRFLWHRAVVLGIEPQIKLRHEDAPWSNALVDTMVQWAGARGSVKLTELCDILRVDVGHEDTIDGSQVWDEYKAGNFATVLEHCRADVERVRAVHQRMMFS